MAALIALAIAYLLGSFSSSILLSKLLKKPDPRQTGSGNPGATNILRTLGRNEAITVLVIDALKAVIALLIARVIEPAVERLGAGIRRTLRRHLPRRDARCARSARA